jgi:hypothetical protein
LATAPVVANRAGCGYCTCDEADERDDKPLSGNDQRREEDGGRHEQPGLPKLSRTHLRSDGTAFLVSHSSAMVLLSPSIAPSRSARPQALLLGDGVRGAIDVLGDFVLLSFGPFRFIHAEECRLELGSGLEPRAERDQLASRVAEEADGDQFGDQIEGN